MRRSLSYLIIPLLFVAGYYFFLSVYPAQMIAPQTATSTIPIRQLAESATGTDVYIPPAPTKTRGCTARGPLPDPECTPGAVFPAATKDEICIKGYSASVRNVSVETKKQVYASYGIFSHVTGEYEVDHLISLELGGSNDVANLWPEAANPTPGFHQKDELENTLHDKVCSGAMTLGEAQKIIATDWLPAWKK